jgi:methionyl aminopeptidase
VGKIRLKTPEEIKIMAEGGLKLREVKNKLAQKVAAGVNAKEIDDLAEMMILSSGGQPSFKMVPGYHWTTCVNINAGMVHGIPLESVIFKKGDLVSVDVGMFYKGFHTDTSISVGVEESAETKRFLQAGKNALNEAIKKVVPGNRIFDVSEATETNILEAGFSPVTSLIGHGVGRELHEDPYIPCFVPKSNWDNPEIVPGLVIAIEVMYTAGEPTLVKEKDGWTIATRDGKISGLFEETVAATPNGHIVLT